MKSLVEMAELIIASIYPGVKHEDRQVLDGRVGSLLFCITHGAYITQKGLENTPFTFIRESCVHSRQFFDSDSP